MHSLTWENIKLIVNIANEMIDKDCIGELPEYCKTEERYYTEILKEYNKRNG